LDIHQFPKDEKDDHEMGKEAGKGQLMDFEGLLWIEKVKIQHADRQCEGCYYFKKLNGPYV
jgi:hypothetical protein